jgi:hypothetical protein
LEIGVRIMFHKLSENNIYNYYSINNVKKFDYGNIFKLQTVDKVFKFAYDMSFGKLGKHRNHRSGGRHERKNGEIFSNAFQGKLAECAVAQCFSDIDDITLDFSVSPLGKWDKADLIVKNYNIAVKSTKYYGNLLLLECKDWDSKGRYIPDEGTQFEWLDYFVLARIYPSIDTLMKTNRFLYSTDVAYNELYKIICKNQWQYDIVGYITRLDLQHIIANGFVIKQGEFLKKTKMDADNYYIQSGDFRDINLLKEHMKGI